MTVNLRKTALVTMIGSVVASALFGIFVILTNQINNFSVRVLMTALTVSVSSLCALSCATLAERKNALGARAGIGVSVLAGVLTIVGLWMDHHSDTYWKITGSTAVLAVATGHFSLLSLARLAGRFAWVRWAAFAAIYALAGLLIWMIFGNPPETATMKPLGVLSILVAAVTIVIPVLHKLSAPEAEERSEAKDRRVKLLCPECALDIEGQTGETVCPRCGCHFSLAILRRGRETATSEHQSEVGCGIGVSQ